ncbi:acyl-CoA thioesterase [Dendrosporobacter sp. 1207_IL3150]|uniref:acyl-CoA thioesterase n=1 Tax=Dendrosporobacter sp. 1207_IL3150 TaxID=3084054 RepID=UPI002FD9EBD6
MEGKSIAQSAVVMSAVMQPNQANPAGNVHGGEIMKMMDNAAFVVAQRHARTNVVTARVDELTFHHPIFVGNWVTCRAHLTFVGRSSMEVAVIVEVEDLYSDESCKCALTAYFTMVAINAGGKPLRVTPLEITNEAEQQAFDEGKSRYETYKQRKHKNT